MAEQTKTTRHPCAGCSKATIEVFEAIAVGGDPPFRPKTIRGLLNAGLIVQVGERALGRDALGAIKVPVYEVPLHIHMQWCEWCHENVSDEEVS